MSIYEPDCVLDVLAKSILMHPSLFADACEKEASDDRRYVVGRPDMDARSRQGALARADALEFASNVARVHDSAACAAMDIMDRNAMSWIAAFNVACRLLCIPPHVRTALVAKEP